MTYRRPIRLGLALLLTAPLLAGCSDGWRTTLGLEQTAPDEFKVAEREPLTMPPSLNELPTPRPGAGRPQATSPRTRARQALFAATAPGQGTQPAGQSGGGFASGGLSDGGLSGGGLSGGNQSGNTQSGNTQSGGSAAASGRLSDGERQLLSRAEAGAAPDDIRELVTREAEARAEAERGLLDDYIFWRDPELPGDVVDADAEAKRLRDNQAQGKPLTEGDVPIQEREDRGLLGDL